MGSHLSSFPAPSDYISLFQVLTFSSSSAVQSVEVSIVNDSVSELRNEIFLVSLSLAEDSDLIELVPDSVFITINDDDGTSTISIVYR